MTARIIRRSLVSFGLALLALQAGPSAFAQPARETLTLAREHRGKPIQVTSELLLPPGTGRVPAVVIQHGSGGVTDAREYRYAREMVAMGIAALVIDSFKPRGIASTVGDQSTVTSREMTDDAFAALKALAAHSRVMPDRIGIFGFSKGGTVALMTARERHAARVLPAGPRFALHVPFYPACNDHYINRRTTGAPVLMLIGDADTYAGVAPCLEYGAKLRADGAKIDVKVYPGAPHGWDAQRAATIATGENWSKCVFEEQTDGTWKERTSGAVMIDKQGRRIDDAFNQALSVCRTLGVFAGPNAAAKAASMNDLKDAVRRHLLRQQ